MKRTMVLKTVLGASILLPTALAQAAEEKGEPATIRFSHNAFRYNQLKTEEKNGTTVKTEESGLQTFPAGFEIAVFTHGYSIYSYPVNQGYAMWLGKAIGETMEFGLTGSFNSHKVKDGPEESNNSFGVYYFYTRPISSKINFEFDINPALLMGSGEEDGTTAGSKIETDSSGFSLYFDLFGVVPIAKNFEYAFGIDYTMKNYEDKVKETGAAEKTIKNTETEFNLIFAKFRYFI